MNFKCLASVYHGSVLEPGLTTAKWEIHVTGFPHNFLNCPSILSHLDCRDPDHSLFTSSLYFMSFGSLGVLSIFSLFNLSSPFSETHHHCHRPICAHVFPRSPSFLSWAPMASFSSHLHVFVSSHLPPSLHPPTLSLLCFSLSLSVSTSVIHQCEQQYRLISL